ncbi:MAG: secretin and TonB N-terminal domain-containing protein [Gallionellaceae bacterium]|nr:secretin and TonB N-terminal domain-containing protein [Gallionellaceae bacterium]MDD5367402.1 secretin and TonB N-terminal domain-containing protein [Gallionellaceae bacterium]
MKTRYILLSAALLLAGCATDQALRDGERMVAEGHTEEGIKVLAEAVQAHPNKVEYRAALIRAREQYIGRLLREADEALKAERFDVAEARYHDVQRQHPENARAQAGLAGLGVLRGNRVAYGAAQAAFVAGELDEAGSLLRTILASEPDFTEAAALLKKVDNKVGRGRGVEFPQLAAAYRKPVTLEFRETPVKTLFDAISQQSGLNFVFDKDVRTDQRTTVLVRNTALADVLDMLLTSSQLSKKVLNGNTLLIYPNTAMKQRDYQDVVVRGFFLANADPKQTMTLLRSIARIRDIHVDEKLNMVVVRDSPEAVRLAEKLVKMVDQPEPEVMLEVEILEVKRSKLLELGLQWPNQLSLLSPDASTSSHVDGGVIITENTPAGRLTIDSLKSISGATVGVSPNPVINFNKTDGDVNLLANPRIRVRNKEKAKIHIGDKVPVITSNVTSTGVTSESVSYLDVGLKLDVEPQVYLDAEVAIKVGMEVSNIVQQVKSSNGTLTYQLGSRNANTILRLKDGETQVLAGLISDEDRSSAAKVPGLGDLPLIGRLFSSHRDEASKTEIVLLITPHIIRNVIRPELADGEFYAGTENVISDQPIRLRPDRGLAGMPRPAVEIPDSVLVKPVGPRDGAGDEGGPDAKAPE